MVLLPDYSNSDLDQRSRLQGHFTIKRTDADTSKTTFLIELKLGRYMIRGTYKNTYVLMTSFPLRRKIAVWSWRFFFKQVFQKLLVTSDSNLVETVSKVGVLNIFAVFDDVVSVIGLRWDMIFYMTWPSWFSFPRTSFGTKGENLATLIPWRKWV